MTESRGPSREGTQGRHQTDFKPATDGISVYFNINDPRGKAASKPPTGAPAPLESGKMSFNTPPSCRARQEMRPADEEDEGGKDVEERELASAMSHKHVFFFESLSPSETRFDYPPLLEKEIDFCLEFVRSGNQKQDNGTPHSERLRGAISNQSARGLTNPSIVPPQPPAAHQHICPHCPPPSCSRICSPQQPVLSEAVQAEVSH